LGNAAAPAAGFGLGFVGMSKLYTALKKKQLENETSAAEQRYISTLNTLREKTAQLAKLATPKTDALIATLLTKEANGGFIKWLMGVKPGDAVDEGAKAIRAKADEAQKWVEDLPARIAKFFGNNELSQAAGAAWLAGAGLSGMGVYHVLNKADRQRAANKKANNFPTEVDINPV
jgi:hypothetical protein